ncbi:MULTISPECIES: chemotaxis protein CheB [unclassified Pannonibacter]|uniref:chemotaxis protein CheB n=1 Tax=unclassified Pannonibacter TaxID=2627228 RepID=UPI00164740E7|nr:MULTISPECIES: chemotaxis protein CheB [unclassified Pannonibacter]
MKRPVIIAAPGAFERSGLRRLVSETFPAADLRESTSAQELVQALDARFAGLVVLDEAMLQQQGAEAVLQGPLARLGTRLIRLSRDPVSAGPPIGTWARDLPDRLRRALTVQTLPTTALQPDSAPPDLPQGAQGSGRAPQHAGRTARPACLLVASSTGGPGALAQLLQAIPQGGPPWIIAQHMPSHGTQAFAAHLSEVTGRQVREAGGRDLPAAGDVIVLRGGQDFELQRRQDGALSLRPALLTSSPFHPNADTLMLSAAASGIAAAALILSGMGEDGAIGAAALSAAGHPVFVQAPETCVVAGMPGAALARLPMLQKIDPGTPPLSLLRLCAPQL